MNNAPKVLICSKETVVLSSLLEQETLINNGPRFGKRHSQAIILATVVFFLYTARATLSVAIVAMTNPTANADNTIPTYNWTDKNLILSAFLWGYCLPQIAAGYVAERYGAKWYLVISTIISSTAGLLIPIAAATFGSKGVMICRAVQGFFQGFLFPSLHAILGKWIPSNERSRLATFVYLGSSAGITVSMLLTGYISTSRFGWPCAFYVFNGASLVVCAIYSCVGSSDPNSHPTISHEEHRFIKTNLNTADNRKNLQTPWKEMLTTPAFLALVMTSVAFNLTHWALMTQMSIYLDKVLQFNLKSNGIMSALPYLGEILVAILACCVADFATSKDIVSFTIIRKIMNNIGFLLAILPLYLVGRTGQDDKTMAIILLVLVGSSHGTGKSGYVVNLMDLAPNFTGVMMGIANGTAIIFSAFAPLLAQMVIQEEKNIGQWRTFFYIIMGVNIFGAIINTFFTSGKRQAWNQGGRSSNP